MGLIRGSAGGGGGDFLSTLTGAEISITGTGVTATISRMHVCSGTTSNYSVTLPAASGNAGKFIGFRMSGALTKFVTLDGSGAETIDLALTRVMWSKEVAILMCDGSNWTKVAGKTIPMTCTLKQSGGQTIASGAPAIIILNVTLVDNTGQMASLGDHRIYIKRPSIYTINGGIIYSSIGANTNTQTKLYKNGSEVKGVSFTVGEGSYPSPIADHIEDCAVDDYIEMYAFHTASSSVGLYSTGPITLTALEIPSW